MHVSTHQAKEDFRNEDLKIYLNGEIVEKANAVVSVYDSAVSYTHLTLPTKA